MALHAMAGSTHNMQVSLENAKPTQHGVYDRNILCAECDGKLGAYDDYALEVCRRFEAQHKTDGDVFSLSDVDGDKFAKFVLAVLWRASISSRSEFGKISLGQYEDVARDVLFNNKPLTDVPAFQVIVARYRRVEGFDILRVYTSPSRVSNLGVNGWGFAISGFRIVAKIDKRAWPGMPAEAAKAFFVNGSDALRGFFVDFEGSVEHRAAAAMALAQRARQQVKKKK